MPFEPGDLVSINTCVGYRVLELTKGSEVIPVERGTRGVVLELCHKSYVTYYKVLVGGSGVWFIKADLISKVRLTFRPKDMKQLEKSIAEKT